MTADSAAPQATSTTSYRAGSATGQWAALIAAFLGWMFDGFEMGLFPLIARPALIELLGESRKVHVDLWVGIMTAGFLVAAAAGGVLFGWLGDRIGRVRAMMLSVGTYAIFSGLCGFSTSAEQIFSARFIASLGMGGEWSLGVALVMELWPDKSRGALAAVIGAASNFGFLAIACCNLVLSSIIASMGDWLHDVGLPESWVAILIANSGWRLLMILGAAPALLTFFIRLAVPESERWLHAREKGSTSHWASQDLLVVCLGVLGPLLMIYLFAYGHSFQVQMAGSIAGVLIALAGFSFPVIRFFQRLGQTASGSTLPAGPTLRKMLLGACLSGIALLGTWGAVQFAAVWVDKMVQQDPQYQSLTTEQLHLVRSASRSYTQIASAIGAIVGCAAGAFLGNALGRRITYFGLCLTSLATTEALFNSFTGFGPLFLVAMFFAGGTSAAFYGWLPLYLPELFPTSVRSTGQGFSYNFGRVLAAVGALQTGNLIAWFGGDAVAASYPRACSVICLIYVVGMGVIWLAPETHGKPLPE